MTAIDERKTIGKEELKRIIESCQTVETKDLNPFLVEVDELIAVIKQYYPDWRDLEDLCLDAEALNQIASIIKLQSQWIKRRASSLYRDPFLVQEKLHILPVKRITELFKDAWHPIVEFEQASIGSLEAAMMYWNQLVPLNERWVRENNPLKETELTTLEELVKQGIIASETFTSELENVWSELGVAVGEEGKIDYWDFVCTKTYKETIKRAYLMSFLVTYGYADLEVNPLKELVFLRPKDAQVTRENTQAFSFPLSISYEVWNECRKDQKD